MINIVFKGHEFSPLIYNYDEQKGSIDFVEKLDQGATAGKQTIGFDILDFSLFLFIMFLYIEKRTNFLRHIRQRMKDKRVCLQWFSIAWILCLA